MPDITCTCGSGVPGIHELDCPAYTPPWIPDPGDHVRIVESGHEGVVTRISWDSHNVGSVVVHLLVEGRPVPCRPADVVLLKAAEHV